MDVMIPPWVRPESPETIRWIDDATMAFPGAFGRGMTQRGIWADPRWGLRRRYRGLRTDEKAAILNALSETRGQLNILRVTPHTPLRGSFPVTELLTNNTFANSTTGWTAYNSAMVVQDRVMRATYAGHTSLEWGFQRSGVTVSQYAAYVVRGAFSTGRVSAANFRAQISDTGGLVSEPAITSAGIATSSIVVSTTSAAIVAYQDGAAGEMSGNYIDVPYVTMARCALADAGVNMLLQSDDMTTTWTNFRSTDSSNTATAPDGSAGGDSIIEDATASNTHGVSQSVTVGAAAADFAFAVALKANTRTWARLTMTEATGSTIAGAYFDLSNGIVGTVATGAQWANGRAFIVSLGNGWVYCSLVARKTNAATSITCGIRLATADNGETYSGDGTSSIFAWRATFSTSGVSSRLVQTAAVAEPGSLSGSSMPLKGLPVSTAGLLEIGDWFEISGELKQCTARLNSDAAGMGVVQFRPALAASPADNEPVIIHEPFGRFIYPQGTREFENLFGVYGDCEMNLEEIYS
jgi:hypothetical protein